jgi:hypothetical protein
VGWSGLPNQMFQFSIDAQCRYLFYGSSKPNGSILETRGSGISRNSDNSSKTTMTEPDDWRAPLVCYLENPIILSIEKFGGKL